MNKRIVVPAAVISGLINFSAYAAPGEYWEITNKMEMPGMPFSMPATTNKVCIPKGGEKDPGKTSGDKSCQMTDIKTVGNKTTWKAHCDHDGQVMDGIGEQTTTANGYDGKMQMKTSGKHEMNMTMAFSGKRIGGSCDSEEQVKKIKEDASWVPATRGRHDPATPGRLRQPAQPVVRHGAQGCPQRCADL